MKKPLGKVALSYVVRVFDSKIVNQIHMDTRNKKKAHSIQCNFNLKLLEEKIQDIKRLPPMSKEMKQISKELRAARNLSADPRQG